MLTIILNLVLVSSSLVPAPKTFIISFSEEPLSKKLSLINEENIHVPLEKPDEIVGISGERECRLIPIYRGVMTGNFIERKKVALEQDGWREASLSELLDVAKAHPEIKESGRELVASKKLTWPDDLREGYYAISWNDRPELSYRLSIDFNDRNPILDIMFRDRFLKIESQRMTEPGYVLFVKK